MRLSFMRLSSCLAEDFTGAVAILSEILILNPRRRPMAKKVGWKVVLYARPSLYITSAHLYSFIHCRCTTLYRYELYPYMLCGSFIWSLNAAEGKDGYASKLLKQEVPVSLGHAAGAGVGA